jgi:acyl-CoA hydrolase
MAERTPVRHGRQWGTGDWKAQYAALKMTADEAARLIRDGEIMVSTGAANWPKAFDEALAGRLRETGSHIELNSQFILQPCALLAPELRRQVAFYSNFFVGERRLADQGNLNFVPTHLGVTGEWLLSRHPRVVVIACSAPDKNGWMSRSLWGAQMHRDLLESCEVLIVEVNPNLPAIVSDGKEQMLLHVSEVDGIIEDPYALPELPDAAVDDTDRAIAGHIADLVPDGACVQFGLGGLASAVGSTLAYAGKHDLGVQSEVIGNCVIELMKRGVVNNSRKQTYPGRAVGAYFIGDASLWDFIADNPAFCAKETSWVNSPRNIARNNHVVSINNAMEIDLTGQVNAESVGPRQYSGTGGQLEWVVGSQWSKGGKSILSMRSTYTDRNGVPHSKIKPALPSGSIVTTPRTCVQYVVTEYGVAELKYKSALERARALIAIAHPDFREELRRKIPF